MTSTATSKGISVDTRMDREPTCAGAPNGCATFSTGPGEASPRLAPTPG